MLNLLKVFTRGLGLRIFLSFLPPIILAWIFFVLYLADLADHRPALAWLAFALGLAGIAVGSLVVFRLIVATVPPLRQLIDVTATLAAGDLSMAIPYRDHPGETGELARALEIFKQHVAELTGVAALKAEKASDLGRKRELMSLAEALEGEVEGTVKHVMSLAEGMTSSTAEVAEAIRRMEGLYQTLAAASTEAQGNVNAVATATDELAAASREIAAQMARTIGITGEAVAQAGQADATMRKLAAVSTQIGDVLLLISSIAAQTNLLALNATIEAARAGEAGKGFAVVANEVKTLAAQTAKAVGTISEQVEGIRSASEEGVRAIEAVGRTIEEVNSVANAVAAAVEQQEATTRAISGNAQNAAIQADRVSSNASGISSEAVNVDRLANLLEKSATDVAGHFNNLERRLTGILVNTVGNEQKDNGHAGKPLAGFIRQGAGTLPCRFEEMEVETARLTGVLSTTGDELDITLDGFGPLRARVRRTGPDGAQVDFLIDEVTKARLGEFLFGHLAEDQFYIKLAKTAARTVEGAFEGVLARGEISLEDLFDHDYKPIPDTNPQQFTARFLEIADRVLPPIQEEILKADSKVVFGLAVNQDGYVSAHHLHYSKPQGPDPVWNAANCRNRRIFNSRAELAGVTHTLDHLVQTYIRDMGGGNMMLLKDASVPIFVRGRHWGGIRLGYKL